MGLIPNNETFVYNNLMNVFGNDNIYIIFIATMVGIISIKIIDEKIFDIHYFRKKNNNYFYYFLDFSCSVFLSTFAAICFVLIILGAFLLIEKIIKSII